MFTSDLEPVAVGGTSVPAFVLDACQKYGQHTALLDDQTGRRITFAQLAHQIDRVGAALCDSRLGGDTVAIWTPNQPEWMSAALGAMAARRTVTGINIRCTDPEVERQLDATGASILFTVPAMAERARKIAPRTDVDEIVVIGEPIEHTTSFDSLLKTRGASPDLMAITDDDIALRPMSSGTSGRPKPVDITHSAVVTMLRQLSATLDIDPSHSALGLPPFPHPMGGILTGVWPLTMGACVVTMPRFDPERFLPAVAERKPTIIVLPPLLAGMMAAHPAAPEALAGVRLLGFGGAPTADARMREVAARFPQITVGQGYGMTELTCVAATMRLDDPGPPESVGRLMPNTEARIVDPESGRDLSANETGEIWIRGPQMMAGYRDRPQATAETVDNEGWIHTGDLGRIDDNGYLFVDDRIKDLIKSKGFQVAPAELEGILTSHPSVRDAAVTSVEDDGDELPVAFVVAANGDIDPDQVRAWVAEQVSSYKRLADLHVVEVIPRNVNGKILRRQLKESLQQ